MIRRKWLSVCIALVLCLLLLPAAALAADGTVYGKIEVGNAALTNSAETPVVYATTDDSGAVTIEGATAENYNIMWDGSTLTLKNATIKEAEEYSDKTNEKIAVYRALGDLNLVLVGENTVDALGGGNAASCGINLGKGSLTISGEDDASLTVYGGPTEHGNSCGIYAYGTITINSGTVTVTGESASAASYGICAGGAVTIEDGTVNATSGEAGGDSIGIYTSNSVTIKNGTVNTTGESASAASYGICAGGAVTIEDGTVNATSGKAGGNSVGIYTLNSVTINGGDVTATAGDAVGSSYGINTANISTSITVNGGTVTATSGEAKGDSCAIFAESQINADDASSRVTINGGTVTARAGNAVGSGWYSCGIKIEGFLTITDGTVIAVAGDAIGTGTKASCGIFSFKNVAISDGDVTGIGGTGEMSWGIACNDILTITGSTVVGEGGPLAGTNIQYSAGINGMGKVEISGGTVTGTGGDTEAGDSFGICTGDTTSYNVVTVSIKDATVTATGGTATNGKSGGISATNTIADVEVTIENAAVTATGGSAGTGSYGILAETTGTAVDVTINGNSVVRANMTGTKGVDGEPISGKTVNKENSIVFENGVGTVYGSVTLRENLTVDTGETLTIPDNATLTIPSGVTVNNSGVITNKGTIENQGTLTIVQGGTLTGEVTGNPVVCTVTVQTDGNGSASASPATAEAGTTVTLTADPDNGWRFSRWEVVEGDVTISGNSFTMPAENVTVRAVFSPIVNIPDTHEIELIVGDGGEAKLSLTNASAGSTITVTATPDEGYELAYITVDGERISGTTFKMPDHDVTVRVYFTDGVALPFTDVSTGAWYFDAVSYVYANGLMDGTSTTTFEPNANMTRAMVWAILARVDGETVTGTNWIETAREWAVANGVSDGENASGYVTREQLAAMLYRYAVYKGYDVSVGEDTNILSYADFADLSEYAIPAMQWACGAGIITGVTDATLVPQGEATRAQVAAMLMRFVEAIG